MTPRLSLYFAYSLHIISAPFPEGAQDDVQVEDDNY